MRLSDKLNYKKLGLFAIKKRILINNYKLLLLKTIRNYSIVYISLLKKALSNILLEEKITVIDKIEYKVE